MVATSISVIQALATRICRTHYWSRAPGAKYPNHVKALLTDELIARHLNGGASIGACPIGPGTNTTRVAVLDMDSHKGDVEWEDMLDQARVIIEALVELGLHAVPFRSSGGSGIHLYLLWQNTQDAYSVREALKITLAKCDLRSGTKGIINREVEIFPKQDSVPADGYGSMFVLPLSMKSCALLNDGTLRDTVSGNINWKGSDDVEIRERTAPVERGTAVGVNPVSLQEPDIAKLKSALDAIPNSGPDELDYDAWRNVIFGIHAATGGDDVGLDLAHVFSSRAAVSDPDFLDTRVWPYIKDRDYGITARTIFALASRHGWMDPDLAGEFEVMVPAPSEIASRGPVAQTDIAGAQGEQDAGSARFEVIAADDFVGGKSPPWIVKGVLPQAALAVIFGESTSGKTFFALDLVCAVARGVAWRGHRVQQGGAVYICAEGISGFRDRVRAYRTDVMYGATGLPLGIVADAPNFLEAEDIKAVICAVLDYQKRVGRIAVIVMDTLARALVGGDENSAQDMGKAVYHAEQLHLVTGATIIFIHHSGKDVSKGARGSNSLRAAADCEIEVSRMDEDREAVVTKLKDGEDGQRYPFKLRSVPLPDLDDDGEVITSCVVEHVVGGGARTGRAPPKLRDKQQWVVDVAKGMADEGKVALNYTNILAACLSQEAKELPEGMSVRGGNIRRALDTLMGNGWFIVGGDNSTVTIYGYTPEDHLHEITS